MAFSLFKSEEDYQIFLTQNLLKAPQQPESQQNSFMSERYLEVLEMEEELG